MFNFLNLFWNKQRTASIIVLASFSLGIFLGAVIFKDYFLDNSDGMACPENLKFVVAEMDCGSFKSISDKVQNIEDNVKRQVKSYLNTNRADRISVFVRDLDSQRFAIINESEQFYMASLLKVPLAIAYYRLAELTPDLLTQKIIYTGVPNLYPQQVILPPKKLVVGTTYTVQDLIYRSLAYSDNTAAELLSENYVSFDYLQKILYTLGLQPKTDSNNEDIVTAKSYAGIFRTLYNSSFLSREYSNEILRILSESTFTDGARKNIPQNINISHKFGERSIVDEKTGKIITRQLHDCGIVYAKDGTDTYSFCIMTEGKDLSNLESIVQNVSETIYNGMTQ